MDLAQQPGLDPGAQLVAERLVLDGGVAAALEVVDHRDGLAADLAHGARAHSALAVVERDQPLAHLRLEDARDHQHRGVQRHAGVVAGRGQGAQGGEHLLGLVQGPRDQHPQAGVDQAPVGGLDPFGRQRPVGAADHPAVVEEPHQAGAVLRLGDGGRVAQHAEGDEVGLVVVGLMRLHRGQRQLAGDRLVRQEGQQDVPPAEAGEVEVGDAGRAGREPGHGLTGLHHHGRLVAWTAYGHKHKKLISPGACEGISPA